MVEAAGYATVRARDNVTVRAARYVAVLRHGDEATVDGGAVIQVPEAVTASAWCELYGVQVADGVAILYKSADDDGPYLCPRPYLASRLEAGERFVAWPVRVTDLLIDEHPVHPYKVSARKAAGPVYEVDIDGHATASG